MTSKIHHKKFKCYNILQLKVFISHFTELIEELSRFLEENIENPLYLQGCLSD
jgi:hypothetical protein